VTNPLGRRFWVEMCMALASAALLVVTVVWRDWIEIVFSVDPDAGSGALEWLVVAVLAAAAIAFSALARSEWKKATVRPSGVSS
jgi:hypothetical protein